MTMLVFIKNIVKFLRHHSLGELFDRSWRILIKPLYENNTRYIVKLELPSAEEPDVELEIKEITAVDITRMLEVMYVSPAGLQRRFERGDRCFAVLNNDKITCYFWAQFGVKNLRELHMKFNLGNNQCWMYNAITIKSARGHGLYPNIILYMSRILAQSGINKAFVDFDLSNTASSCGLEKAGCKRVVLVERRKVLFKISYKLTIFDKDTWSQLSHNNPQL